MNEELTGERDVDIAFLVVLKHYGDPEKIKAQAMTSVARAIHHSTHIYFEIAALPEPEENVIQWYRFDPQGDDMGNHGPEHPEALVPLETQEVNDWWGRWR